MRRQSEREAVVHRAGFSEVTHTTDDDDDALERALEAWLERLGTGVAGSSAGDDGDLVTLANTIDASVPLDLPAGELHDTLRARLPDTAAGCSTRQLILALAVQADDNSRYIAAIQSLDTRWQEALMLSLSTMQDESRTSVPGDSRVLALEREIHELQRKLAALETRAHMTQPKEESSIELIRLRSELQRLESRIVSRDEELAEIESKHAAECERTRLLNQRIAHLEPLEKEIPALRDQVDELRHKDDELRRAKTLLAKMESRMRARESRDETHDQVQSELEQSQRELKSLEKEYFRLSQELSQIDEVKRTNAKLELEVDRMKDELETAKASATTAPRTPTRDRSKERAELAVSPKRLVSLQSSIESIAVLAGEESVPLDRRMVKDHVDAMRESLSLLQTSVTSGASAGSSARTKTEQELIEIENSYRQLSGSYSDLKNDYSIAQNTINALELGGRIPSRQSNSDLRKRLSASELQKRPSAPSTPERAMTPTRHARTLSGVDREHEQIFGHEKAEARTAMNGNHDDVQRLRSELEAARELARTQKEAFERERRLMVSVLTSAGLDIMTHHRTSEAARSGRNGALVHEPVSPTAARGTPKISMLQRSSMLQTPGSASRGGSFAAHAGDALSPPVETRSAALGRFVTRKWLAEARAAER